MGNVEVSVDRMSLLFARVMTIFMIAGIILMVVPSAVYFAGEDQYIPLEKAYRHWNRTTDQFWIHVKGIQVHGYGWIFRNLEYSDCQSMVGVFLLMLTPLISMVAAIFRAPKVFRLLFGIAAVEFVISIIVKGVL
ncbi:hypothetical protein [Archaeoglobus neptunius]|uniref:hypothetical protein n=1 Tax=Archaeoglobus neptunius TaxID=2798580 RepID=UPI00192749E7|nr:hypothetical protein [Archaeoglobus neptunius]